MQEVISGDQPSDWMEALERTGNYDVYHLPEYHQIDSTNASGIPQLFTFADGDAYGVFPFFLRDFADLPWADQAFCDARSAYGYPGAICNAPAMKSATFGPAFLQGLMNELRARQVVSLFARQHPVLSPPSLFGDHAVPAGPTVVLSLDIPIEEQMRQCRKSHRYELKKTRKAGVVVEHDDGMEQLNEFIAIYEERMQDLDAADSYFFPRAYYEDLKARLSDQTKLLHARLDGQVIASSMFFVSKQGIQYHLSGTRKGFEGLSPTRAIIEEVRQWGTEAGKQWFHLGGGLGGNEDSLFRFKAGFSKARAEFSVARLIIDEAQYADHCAKRPGASDDSATTFFPAYRA